MILKLSTQIIAAALLGSLAVHAAEPSSPKKPNILVFLADDYQHGAVHALGDKEIITPNIDKLVEQGTTFTSAHAEIPTCQPSRASMLSGCSSFTHHAMYPSYSTSFNRSLLNKSWTSTLRDAGYRTFWTGKWNTYGKPGDFGIQDSSRVFQSGMGDHNMTFEEDGQTIKGFSSTLFCDAASRYLRQRHEINDGQPFFATVSFTAPHDPRTPPQAYRDMYDTAKLPLPASYMPEHPFDDGYFQIRDEKLLPRPRTEAAVKEEIAKYYGLITQMDEQIGKVLQTLKDTGDYDNTIIIFLGDHGLAIGRHGLLGKMNMYRHSTETPLIFVGPGIPKNRRTDALVYLHDLFPTTCSMVGVPVPATVEGKDLTPIIEGKTKDVRDSIFCANANLQRMVRTHRYKLIRFYHDEKEQIGSDRFCFFDLETDPNELHDLINDPAQKERIEEFKTLLTDWQTKLKDPFAL